MELLETKYWDIGNARLTRIVEIGATDIITEIIEDADPATLRKHPWLFPKHVDEDNRLLAVVQTFCIQQGNKSVVIDTCVGNDKERVETDAWSNLQTDFLKKFEEACGPVEDVDIVLCTHLHFDHVGWNTVKENDRWVPTFPKATYLFSKEEFEYWDSEPEREIPDDLAAISDSVRPIIEAGQFELVDDDHQVTDSISLVPTPGHTPHHVSVLVNCGENGLLISGDFLHHPCQIAEQSWSTLADFDQDAARKTRINKLGWLAENQVVLAGSHFHDPTLGRIRRAASGLVLDSSEFT